MWRPEVLGRWLGSGSSMQLEPRSRCTLGDDTGIWRRGVVATVKKHRLVAHLQPAATWPQRAAPATEPADVGRSTLTISVHSLDPRRCRVHLQEEGLPPDFLDEAAFHWQSRLADLKNLEREIVNRRDRARQAVVVIHGIGEQQPGVTLRNLLASGVFGDVPADEMWVKPDRLSQTFDLRSAVLKASFPKNRPSTEVYELYWAHVIRDTTASQVGAWARKLLFKRGAPRALVPVRFTLWVMLFAASALLVFAWWQERSWLEGLLAGGLAVTLALLLARQVAKFLFIDIVGDAARYLLPLPANIAHRQRIREMGVDLLEKLHQSKRFDRIVVLGHSLGSVIAYDILTHAWSRQHRDHENPAHPSFQEVRTLEKNLDETDVGKAQELQHQVWQRLRRNTQPWLVTDLVTVGSPLTYADFLISSDKDDFERACAERTLPTCPPAAEIEPKSGHRRISFEDPYGAAGRRSRKTFTCLHHGAPFAAVRWTNLYFAVSRFGFVGDLVGGPLAPLFGPWVRDVEMPSPKKGISHTCYWQPMEREDAAGQQNVDTQDATSAESPPVAPAEQPKLEPHLAELRDALDLDRRRELTKLLGELPAHVLLD